MNMLHHMSIPVSNIEISKKFYNAALETLGYRCVFESETFVGYGIEDGKDKFALVQRGEEIAVPGTGFHISFSAKDRESIDDFYTTALENGGSCNGPAGLRLNYGVNYYAAFIIDPDGYHIEAVNNISRDKN
jgi:catechol 2,3-dioxygenase-like lactoylglutathione lyase family enzyme